jgi:hypothetical protein
MILHFLNFLIWALLAAVVVWPCLAWIAQMPVPSPRHFHLRAFKPGEMIFTPPPVVLCDDIKAKMRAAFADRFGALHCPGEACDDPDKCPLRSHCARESGWETVAEIDPAAIYDRWNMKATPYHKQFAPPDLRTSFNRRCRYVNCNAFRFPCADCAIIRGGD